MPRSISIRESDLERAAQNTLIDHQQIQALWQFLASGAHAERASTPRFGFGHVMYYFGGLIAIGALTMFTTLGFSQMGFGFLTTVSIAYLVLFLMLTEKLLAKQLSIPAGITAALAVSMVPLVIFSLQNLLGMWHSDSTSQDYRDYHYFIDWRWIMMEIGTFAAAAMMFYRYRLPFMLMPVAVTGWYFSMDLAQMLSQSGVEYGASHTVQRVTAIVVGLVMIVISLLADRRNQRQPDFGFWLCLFGAFSFWGGVCWSHSDVWWHKHAFAALCVVMIFAGALLQRRVFTILGAMSFAGYLSWLSYSMFANSLLFPIVLSAIGLAIVGFGIWWHKHEDEFEERFGDFLFLSDQR
jgi:hypothetical protein